MKHRLALPIAGLLLGVSLLVALSFGGAELPLGDSARLVLSALGLDDAAGIPTWMRVVLLDVRLPRVLLALVCGGALATAGGTMQGLFQNPMADPGILGVSAGAALGAVSALYLLPASAASLGVPLLAFLGALGCALGAYLLSRRAGRADVHTLLLAGVAIGGVASAGTSLLLSVSLADWEVGRAMLDWLMGGLDGRGFRELWLAAPMALGGSLWLMAYARDLDVLSTGEESAMAVGLDVARVRRQLLALSSLVTAATVAVMGVVGFVGLMVPHLVRLWVGPRHARLLPLSFVVGAGLLIWA
ncbi:MAG: iron ABC transporter permease, partial [Deltaproteobacteria bacterium]|nr:iron ABC transporter permease [Deltaproteobacteria bacterium]